MTRARYSKRGGTRRSTDWQLGVIATGFTTVPANSKVLLTSFLSATLLLFSPSTIVRTRGLITWASDQVGAAESPMGAFGVSFVNEVAAALGVTALPGPGLDQLFDGWFVHQHLQHRFEGTGQGPVYNQIVIDSKAMRKFESDEALVVMVENTSAVGALLAVSLRFLIKAG